MSSGSAQILGVAGSPRFFFLVALFGAICAAQADYLDDIGYTKLQAEMGLGAAPNGTGVGVSQIEAEYDPNTHQYAPDANLFPGKTITIESGSYAPSPHATQVGQYLYGSAARARESPVSMLMTPITG